MGDRRPRGLSRPVLYVRPHRCPHPAHPHRCAPHTGAHRSATHTQVPAPRSHSSVAPTKAHTSTVQSRSHRYMKPHHTLAPRRTPGCTGGHAKHSPADPRKMRNTEPARHSGAHHSGAHHAGAHHSGAHHARSPPCPEPSIPEPALRAEFERPRGAGSSSWLWTSHQPQRGQGLTCGPGLGAPSRVAKGLWPTHGGSKCHPCPLPPPGSPPHPAGQTHLEGGHSGQGGAVPGEAP